MFSSSNMSKVQEDGNSGRNGPILPPNTAVNNSPSNSDSSDGGEEEIDEDSALEYILRGKQDFLTSKIMLQGAAAAASNDGHSKIDADTQARLEALLEAAGVAKLADGKAFADPDVLRRLTSSVSSALDEAAAALTRMRTQNNGVASSANHATDAGIHSLANACLEGNVNAVRKLLEQGWSVHDSTDEGESLLSLACSAGYCELAQVLLAMKAKVDDRGNKGDCTPLMEASSGGFLDIVQLLLDHGADVNAQSQAGNTALIYACCGGYEDVVKMLLDHGALIEAHNENGHTPLMEAASGGHVNVAKLLLDRGACINSHSNEFKESALTLACYKGHVEMVKFLLDAGADQEHKTDEMHTALMEASMDGHVEVARLLLDHGAEVNMPADSFESPLTLAACGGHVELASLLIDREAFLEEVNDEGYTPLMEAAREGHLDMVALLLEKGADLHAQTEETQETALSLTCCGGFQDVAAFLLDRGADIEQGSSTPLMEASQEGHVDLVKFLLVASKGGANVNATTATGDTPLSFACENGHTDVADILLEAGAELEHESEGGRTPLMKAARAGHLCTVQFLISRGADVNRATTSNDHTVLSLACAGGYQAVVELLLAHGAKVNHMLKDNSTMLVEACKGGHTSVARLLLETPLHALRQEYPFAAMQTSLHPSTSPPRVPPVPSLDQLDTSLPGLNTLSSSALDLMVTSDMLSAGVPLTNDKLDFLPDSLYKSALISELSRDDDDDQRHLEMELARVKHSEITPPLPFQLDEATINITPTLLEEPVVDETITDEELAIHMHAMEQDEVPSCDFIASQIPLTPTPSPASPTFEPAIDIEQQTDNNHDTALSVAAAGGHDDLVNLLLLRGAELEHRDKKGCTPLILAATAGHASTVQMLLDHDSDIEAQSDRTKDTSLSLACSGGRQEVVEALIAGNANFEHRNVSDYTPLSLAASGGYIGIVKILLAHGAEINSRTGSKLGISPLMLAAMNGHTATVKLLLDMGADINAQIETNRNTALTLACFQGRHEVVSLLVERKANIEHRAKTGLTPLMEAASGGYVDVGRVLLDKGADVNAPPVPSSRDTALTIAADKGHQKFCELLLSRGAIVEVRNKKGSTPLWLAANGGHLEVVQLLVRFGSDVNTQDNRKVSVLMAAFRKGHVKTVKWLVRHVTQFPSESDTARFISTLSDKELLKKCQTCMGVIRHAKDRQEAEAEKNASILLEELDMEKAKEKVRKEAAARRREKKKKKKKKNKEDKGVVKEEEEDDEEGMREEEKKSQQHRDDEVTSTKSSPQDDKAATDAMDALTNIAITSAAIPAATSADNPAVSDVLVVTTTEITKVVASTMYTSSARISEMSPITVATAAAQCVSVTLTTTSPIMSAGHTRTKTSSSGSRRGRKHEDGWNVVIRRFKKLSVPSSVISRVIGRGGCNVNAIRDATGAHIDIDTSNQKATGACTVTIKGPAEATKQANHLIVTLIKDPDCDINDHLPRSKHPVYRYDPAVASVSTSVYSSSTMLSHSVPRVHPTSSGKRSRHSPTTTTSSSSHLPGNARWASPTYQPPTATQPLEVLPPLTTTASSDFQPAHSGGKVIKSPAARQLVFVKSTSPVAIPTVAKTRTMTTTTDRGISKQPLSYSTVAGGSMPDSPGQAAVEDAIIGKGVDKTALPPVISNILSQVCQTRSPIVWNEFFPQSSLTNHDVIDDGSAVEVAGESHEFPLTVATSGATGSLFKPVPAPPDVSPPNPPGSGSSPASSASPVVVNNTPSPPATSQGVLQLVEDSEKPLPAIGTERAQHRRTNTSPTLHHGTASLMSHETTGDVWRYYPANPTSVSTWPTAAAAVSSNTSPRPIPSSSIPPLPQCTNDSLQEFLDSLGLSNYLVLFQKNEIDLDALLLMNETDYAEIGLPQGPSTKLLNSTRGMYNNQQPEMLNYHGHTANYINRPVIRPNYHHVPPVRPHLPWRQPLPGARAILQPHALPNGSLPTGAPETYNGGHGTGLWSSWSRTAI